MITPDWVRLMAAYNAEMNRRLYAAADRLTPDQRTEDRGAFFGSVQGTLSHLLWGDRFWMHRFDGWEKPPGGIAASPTLYADWEALKRERAETDAGIEGWASRVDPAWLTGSLSWFSAAQSACSMGLPAMPPGGFSHPSKRCIQNRSPHRRWLSVPWTERKKAPRSSVRRAGSRRSADA